MMQSDFPKRLRIAILSRGFFSQGGGAENYSIALVERLAERHDVHVFTQHLSHDHAGVTYHLLAQCVPRPSWIDLLCFDIRCWWATRRGFDVVHSHENTWHGMVQTVHVRPVKVGLFHQRKNFRKAIRYLQIATSIRLWTYLILERMRFSFVPGKAVIACSEVVQQEIESAYPGLRGKTFLLPPGVCLPALLAAPKKIELRRTLGIPDGAHVLLFVGNDYEKKGLRALLYAMQELANNVLLIVIGNSVHIPKFSKLATELAVDERVKFVGAVSSVAPFYQSSDVLIHPTLEDTFSMVVLEGLAHALPVIVSSSAYCGITQHLHHQVDSLILKNPHSAKEIATFVQLLQDAPSVGLALGTAGRQFASGYDWGALAKRQEAIYVAAVRR
jgi:glycosyltransferase involved in cell wall biosynthesis